MVATTKMERLGDVIVHSNEDDTYFLAINPGLWLVAAGTPAVLGDEIPGSSMAEMHRVGIEPHMIERYKIALNMDIFCEYLAIRNSATRHHIPTENVRIFIGPKERFFLDKLSSHTLSEEIPQFNPVVTRTMIDDAWPHSSHAEYVAWFHQTFPDFEQAVAVLTESHPPPSAPPAASSSPTLSQGRALSSSHQDEEAPPAGSATDEEDSVVY